MRINRSKAARKILKLYKLLFNVQPPFNVLLDGNFIFTALKYKINIIDRMKRLLQENMDGEIHFYCLKSMVNELKQIGSKGVESLDFIKSNCREIDDTSLEGALVADRTVTFMKSKLYLQYILFSVCLHGNM